MKIDWRNRVAKWRLVFAGWQLGTRDMDDPEAQAVRDHREATIMLRAEANALAALLIAKGVFTAEEYTAQLEGECEYLCSLYEKQFPGFKARDDGMAIDTQVAVKTTRGWRP